MELLINLVLHAGAIGMVFYAGYLYGRVTKTSIG